LVPAVQAPCDHGESSTDTSDKPEHENCESVRYGMLAIGAKAGLPKFEAVAFQQTVSYSFTAPGFSISTYRPQGPPVFLIGLSPHLSHIALRC
jgi:hypothetical protein